MSDLVTVGMLGIFVGYCMGIATAVMFLTLSRLIAKDEAGVGEETP